jgi:hypothetical protein
MGIIPIFLLSIMAVIIIRYQMELAVSKIQKNRYYNIKQRSFIKWSAIVPLIGAIIILNYPEKH